MSVGPLGVGTLVVKPRRHRDMTDVPAVQSFADEARAAFARG